MGIAHTYFMAEVSNTLYGGATEGRVWVRLGHIKYSTKKVLNV